MKRWLLPLSLLAALILALAGGGYRWQGSHAQRSSAQRSPGPELRVGAAVGWIVSAWERGTDDVPEGLADPLRTPGPVEEREEEKQGEGGEEPSKSGEAPFAATPVAWTPRSLALFFASLKAGAPAGTAALLRGEDTVRQHPARAPPRV